MVVSRGPASEAASVCVAQRPQATHGQEAARHFLELEAQRPAQRSAAAAAQGDLELPRPLLRDACGGGSEAMHQVALLRAAHAAAGDASDAAKFDVSGLKDKLCSGVGGDPAEAVVAAFGPSVEECKLCGGELAPEIVATPVSEELIRTLDINMDEYERIESPSDDWLEDAKKQDAIADGDTTTDEEPATQRQLEAPLGRLLVLQMGCDADGSSADDSCRSSDEAVSPVHAPMVRRGSDACFADPDQTVVIFDWDDTLCPSTTCMERHGLSNVGPLPEAELAEALRGVALKSKAVLEQAHRLAAKVVIVTNAGEGWVESSCAAWMPDLVPALDFVDVVSARAKWEPCGVSSPTGWKTREFQSVIDRFYSRYERQSWKNIIAVGDAPYEHEALRRVVEEAPWACVRKCRSKSVRFVTKPSIEQLKLQLQTLCESLREIVSHDGDIDVQFPEELLPVE